MIFNKLMVFASGCASGNVSLGTVNKNMPCGATNLPTVNAGTPELQQILTIFFGILAGIAVLFVIIGGFRYVISNGKPQDMTKAKDTIIYALVGLVVALSAEAIVSFALSYAK